MPIFPSAPPAPASFSDTAVAGRSRHGPVEGITLDNELVRVTGRPVSSPSFVLEFWDGAEWRAKALDLWLGLAPLSFNRASIIENRPELVTVQYEASVSGGRVVADVTLRRGMRTAWFQVSTNSAEWLSVSPNPTEAMTKTSEREVSNLADANGHKLLLGSPRTWTQTPSTGLLTRTLSRDLTFYAGLVLSGAGAGDTAADLSMQAIGMVWDSTRALRR